MSFQHIIWARNNVWPSNCLVTTEWRKGLKIVFENIKFLTSTFLHLNTWNIDISECLALLLLLVNAFSSKKHPIEVDLANMSRVDVKNFKQGWLELKRKKWCRPRRQRHNQREFKMIFLWSFCLLEISFLPYFCVYTEK